MTYPVPDIFEGFTNRQFPNHCYIIGTSPTVKRDLTVIHKDAAIIYLNKAIELKDKNRGGIWLCADETIPDEHDWFNKWNRRKIMGIKIFSIDIHLKGHNCDYTFRQNKSISGNGVPEKGVLKFDGTVAAQALQLAYWCGSKVITLAGISMFGNGYFDKTTNIKHKPKETWGQRYNMQCMIDYLINRCDISISSLTKTALDVPYIHY